MPNMILFFISSIHSSFDAGNIIKVNQIARQIECPVDNTNGLPVTLLEGMEKGRGRFRLFDKIFTKFSHYHRHFIKKSCQYRSIGGPSEILTSLCIG